jgi:Tol biopolymer transport system component
MSDSRPSAERPSAERLDSWKEIAAYLRRDVTTVQRWEKREGMPVHRHLHDKLGSVYAFKTDLDAWARRRSGAAAPVEGPSAEERGEAARPRIGDAEEPGTTREGVTTFELARAPRRRWRSAAWSGLALVALATAGAAWLASRGASEESPLAGARFQRLTDFDGIEQAAAISRDGRFVAFQSDRDGRMDVWLTQIGTGRFVNLTRGSAAELVNPSIRTLGFSPDGSLVAFWARGRSGSPPPGIDVWVAPLLGGPARPFLEGAAELDWSSDGSRLVFHTPGPGDPTFVAPAADRAGARRIYSAPAGLHAHFPLWAPDGSSVYLVIGTPPDHLDLWRVRAEGGEPERLTHHDALVSHPVFVDDRTLLYLAKDADGSGPWIYALDVERPAPRRASAGLDTYTSLAASADGARLVAAVATPKRTLWRVPFEGGRADVAASRVVSLTTADGASPRLGPGFLLYVSSKGAGDGLWKLAGGGSTELWSAPDARIVGAPAIARDGRRVAFTVRQGGRTALHVVNADGTEARVVTDALELTGAPAWTPDGGAVTVAAVVDGAPRLFSVPLDGRAPSQLVAEHALDPVWSPSGDLLVFSGADVGTTFPVRAVNADASPSPLPELRLTRGGRHLAFLPGTRTLVVLRGEIHHKDLWAIDLATGAERRLTELPPDFDVRDFDVSSDGRELVLERVQEHSDIALIERRP